MEEKERVYAFILPPTNTHRHTHTHTHTGTLNTRTPAACILSENRKEGEEGA